MTLAAPFLYVLGGLFLGFTFDAWRRHKILGIMALIISAAAIIVAVTGTSVTVRNPIVRPSHSPSPSVSATPKKT
jgi:hypothetical protein